MTFMRNECKILIVQELNASRYKNLNKGMGRGVRSNSDTCAVILMGRDISDVVYGRNGFELLFSSYKSTDNNIEIK